jgi:DNA adenine methylase
MISYIGGKSKIGKWIVPFYPHDMETYVEPFSGMFWCFFNMDLEKYPNLKKVVYNDFNPLNYNLFQCVQNPLELQRAMDDISVQQLGVENTPIEFKEKFVNYQAEIFAENVVIQPCDYIFAAKYVYVLSQVFSGSKPETSNFIDLKGKYRSKYLAFRDKLSKPNWVEHFIKITNVENLDFQQVIEKYDSPSTYIYLDPPYWKTENYYSNHDFDRQDHERLAKVLNNIKGKFSLSYYDFEILHEWFPEDVFRWKKKNLLRRRRQKRESNKIWERRYLS